jgi:hypothetical protein
MLSGIFDPHSVVKINSPVTLIACGYLQFVPALMLFHLLTFPALTEAWSYSFLITYRMLFVNLIIK